MTTVWWLQGGRGGQRGPNGNKKYNKILRKKNKNKSKTAKYVEQTLLDIQGKLEKYAVVIGDFNAILSESNRKKKDIEEFNNIVNKFDLIDTFSRIQTDLYQLLGANFEYLFPSLYLTTLTLVVSTGRSGSAFTTGKVKGCRCHKLSQLEGWFLNIYQHTTEPMHASSHSGREYSFSHLPVEHFGKFIIYLIQNLIRFQK